MLSVDDFLTETASTSVDKENGSAYRVGVVVEGNGVQFFTCVAFFFGWSSVDMAHDY